MRECNPPNDCPGSGVQTCRDGEWSDCEGYPVPTEEVCNGFDDDCDGETDESDPLLHESCGTDVGVCRKGRWSCIQGELVCAARVDPSEEVCDGWDNDCDGQTDEGIEQKLCYSLGMDDPSLGTGICHAGVEVCQNGEPRCLWEQVPEPEQCNGLDNNCDGEIDRPNTPQDIDIALLVDQSGSMTTSIDKVKAALSGLLGFFPNTVRVAVVGVPVNMQDKCGMLADFSLPGQVGGAIKGLTSGLGGNEPTFDCVFGACADGSPLGLSWRPEAVKHVVLITDETCQSDWCLHTCADSANLWCSDYVTPDHRLAEADALLVCQEADIRVHVVAPKAIQYFYQDLVDETGGRFLPLRTSPDGLENEIRGLFSDLACL